MHRGERTVSAESDRLCFWKYKIQASQRFEWASTSHIQIKVESTVVVQHKILYGVYALYSVRIGIVDVKKPAVVFAYKRP